ncbi:MAG: endonuclease III [Opitutia bacterium TMED67]|nr:endonuclease III [Verrucomicrobiales bacterium]OUU78034.1 MAG: endonuclease III [Opitutae bacterium TMED67]RZO60805.1 MAG: endonuclease III [Limisphaerales bacterium]|tara:strand:+ start:134 stop:799 length:666 start_codon:yes stop_codon:yes gene_type:complete
MPRESIKAKTDRTAAIIYKLQITYPNARCELTYSSPLELLIATILSAQCTDKQVNIVTSYLFKKYRAASDYIEVHLEELQNDIKRIGLFRNKSKSIQKCCRSLIENHGGSVPANMKSLIALAGVGRKTANVVLGNAFNINEGVVVDTHVARLSNRLGFTLEKTPEKIEINLQKLVPRNDWTMFSHWLIWHGRRRCSARNPDCSVCEIAELCPSEKNGTYIK